MPQTEAERLAHAWMSHFWASNHDIKWLSIETEKLKWLTPNTVLVGKQDALGETSDGVKFFGDWKTGSKNKARYIEDEKMRWRMSPQALTYGVLNGDETTHFTVRWALKTDPATCAFEWYSYEQPELEWWTHELVDIADSIRHLRAGGFGRHPRFEYHLQGQWPTNLTNCTRYGEKYHCPFRDEGCYIRNFAFVPEFMHPRTESHLQIENDLLQVKKQEWRDTNELVVLDASRVGDWLHCHEFYRRLWEGAGLTEENEALTIGTEFHALIAAHLNSIKAKQETSHE